MVCHCCINFKHTDCDYKDYDDLKEEEKQSDENTLSTIPKEIFDGYELETHSNVVEHD